MKSSATNVAAVVLVVLAILFIAVTAVLLILGRISFVVWLAADLAAGFVVLAAVRWFNGNVGK